MRSHDVGNFALQLTTRARVRRLFGELRVEPNLPAAEEMAELKKLFPHHLHGATYPDYLKSEAWTRSRARLEQERRSQPTARRWARMCFVCGLHDDYTSAQLADYEAHGIDIRNEPPAIITRAADPLHTHHLTYARLGAEQPSDLVMLCEEHHDQCHVLALSAGCRGSSFAWIVAEMRATHEAAALAAQNPR